MQEATNHESKKIVKAGNKGTSVAKREKERVISRRFKKNKHKRHFLFPLILQTAFST